MRDQQEHLTAEIAALEAQLAEKLSEQKLIIRKQMKGLLTEQTADAMLVSTAEQIARLESRLADALARRRLPEAPQSRQVTPERAEVTRTNTAGHLARLPHHLRVQLLRRLVRAVIIHEDGSWSIAPLNPS